MCFRYASISTGFLGGLISSAFRRKVHLEKCIQIFGTKTTSFLLYAPPSADILMPQITCRPLELVNSGVMLNVNLINAKFMEYLLTTTQWCLLHLAAAKQQLWECDINSSGRLLTAAVGNLGVRSKLYLCSFIGANTAAARKCTPAGARAAL